MTIDWGAFITQAMLLIIGGAVGGGFVGWYTSRSVVAKNLSEAAGKLVESYGHRLRDVEKEQRRQGRYVRYLLEGIKRLLQQIDELGGIPEWTPQDIDIVCPEDGA
jgi:hypothetical protein